MNDILAEFEFKGDGTEVLKYPAGHEPKSCCYCKKTGHCQLSFQKEQCAGCRHKDECKAKIFKHVSKVTVSIKGHENAMQQRLMESGLYKLLTRIRNGIETIPSILRRAYGVDTMPVRELAPSEPTSSAWRLAELGCRLFFSFKIGALRADVQRTEACRAWLNCKKLFTFRREGGRYAQNPLLSGA